jgi:hypothetical protein
MLSETYNSNPRRHGERVAMRVPVEIRGIADDGSVHEESTHTGVVGIGGAMIHTSLSLQIGAEVTVTNRFSQQTATFRVVWIGEDKSDASREIGLESLQPLDDFWGVRFPPPSISR